MALLGRPIPPALRRAIRRALPRAAVASLVVVAALVAWREGGGADARPPVPHAPPEAASSLSSAAATPRAGRGAPAVEVTRRLLDALSDARLDVPSLAAAQPYLAMHWRHMRAPWTSVAGPAAPLALQLALRTSPEAERQRSVAQPGGDSWVPQARVWNMNEGSFDQRECIFAPTPATIVLRVEVPPAARLRVSPAVLTGIARTTVFEAAVVDAGGRTTAVASTRIAGSDARHWIDVDADLAPWAGQRVELRLRTATDEPAAGEKGAPPVPRSDDARDPASDGGAAEPPAIPPMSLALWGDPVIVAERAARVPYDVLWVVIDALRPDVAASLHEPSEDAARLAAARPPLDALLPAVPGLMPSLDGLAARGVRFPHAWSAATWTRPGTLAMLAGERSGELGIDTTSWILTPGALARYYASDPPLLPLLLRRDGVVTASFVNNFFLAGYVPVGVDMGLERVTDHRYRTRDTAAITGDALEWLRGHAKDRFFLFVNFNSPHEPYDPPKEMLARVPPPPAGPRDRQVRAYMAEAAKDDAALGALLAELDTLGLTSSTLVVVTADHGETLSAAHDAEGMEGLHQRFHHAIGHYEETTRVPLVLALPGVLDGGRAVLDRVRSVDLAPTVLEVEGLEPDPRMSGRSLLPLARGAKEADPRVVVSEGRQSRGLLWSHWHLVAGDGREAQLYDLDADPGERHDVARAQPDVVAELQARLSAALANVPAADAKGPAPRDQAPPALHLRFATAGRARRVAGEVRAGDRQHGATVTADAVGAAQGTVRVDARALGDGTVVTFAMDSAPEGLVGLDLHVEPPGAPVTWRFYLDDAPWPDRATFAGPFGLPAVAARAGVADDRARAEVDAPALPIVDPARDLGVFVTRDRTGGAAGPDSAASAGEGTREMQRVLEDWGYAQKSGKR
jgi:arylsulfatase A-like enzyme